MKREIKFRAWNPQFKEMFYSVENDGYEESRHFSPFIFDIGTKCGWASYHFNLMQFIGLKDKNGVEIYEGDMFEHNGVHYLVKYSENQFCLLAKVIGSATNWRSLEWVNNVQKYIEVIGNIYQNPELLP